MKKVGKLLPWVPIAVCGIELGGETARIAQGFREWLPCTTAEKRTNTGVFALAEDLGHAQVADIGAGDELAMGAGAAGMHHAFGNALAVETLQLLQQLHVLQQH